MPDHSGPRRPTSVGTGTHGSPVIPIGPHRSTPVRIPIDTDTHRPTPDRIPADTDTHRPTPVRIPADTDTHWSTPDRIPIDTNTHRPTPPRTTGVSSSAHRSAPPGCPQAPVGHGVNG
ncbi:hypothetical protein [Streptomyces sp. NPDC087856]|uniref:hypothetical protein n=1 Tax=Streptomyces sp. NPDC087856 TaxID=3365811 RepID=UPI003829BDFB